MTQPQTDPVMDACIAEQNKAFGLRATPVTSASTGPTRAEVYREIAALVMDLPPRYTPQDIARLIAESAEQIAAVDNPRGVNFDAALAGRRTTTTAAFVAPAHACCEHALAMGSDLWEVECCICDGTPCALRSSAAVSPPTGDEVSS